jgi:hypothetical protein
MNKKYLIIILVFAVTFACKNETPQPETSNTKIEGLALNNNEKWVANNETHKGMQRIDSILKTTTVKSGQLLGALLSKETSYIIKNCDMTGEAHDQLHIVLVPILETITDIKTIENSLELKEKVTILQNLSATYFEYFKN